LKSLHKLSISLTGRLTHGPLLSIALTFFRSAHMRKRAVRKAQTDKFPMNFEGRASFLNPFSLARIIHGNEFCL
jgi:hypothetical protein